MMHFTNSLEVYATTITCIQHSIKWCVHYKEMKKVRFEQQTQLGANQLFLHLRDFTAFEDQCLSQWVILVRGP